MVLLRVPLQAQAPQQVLLPTLNQLIEDVKVSLAVVLVDHSGLLQQVVDDVTPNGRALSTGQRPWMEGRTGRERGGVGVLRSHEGSSKRAGSIGGSGESCCVPHKNADNNKKTTI